MALKYQRLKESDVAIKDWFNALIQTNRGDIATTTTYTYDANGNLTQIETTGDIEKTVSITYSGDDISSITITHKEYFYLEKLTPDGSYTEYTSNYSPWDSSYTAEVYVNGTLQTSGYTVDYTNGKVTFSSALTSSDVVRASFRHLRTVTISITYDANGNISQVTRSVS